jgi:chromosome segregation ATPase
MQQNQMQYASDQYRSGLELSRDNQINSLTGAESGMTKEQIEERQRQLTEEEYQTNLKLRDLEDEIYKYNRLIRDEQDQINIIKDQIEVHNQKIKDYEYQIFEIEVEHLRNLQAEQIANDGLLAQADHAVTLAAREEKIQLAKFERSRTLEQATQDLQLAGLEILEQQGKLHSFNFDMLEAQTKQAKKFWDYMTKGSSDVGKIKMPKLQTPNWDAEYKKYREAAENAFATADMSATDISDLAKITPRFATVPSAGAVPSQAVSGIMGITNNTMNNNVNVNAQGASADEVVDIVIRRLRLEKDRWVREL